MKHILIIEDEKGIRESLQEVLEYEGFQVSTASHGREGLEMLESNLAPAIILLDLMMPVMNGWEFAEAVNKSPEYSSIPIIIVSAFADKAEAINAKGIVKKPINLDQLLSLINEWAA